MMPRVMRIEGDDIADAAALAADIIKAGGVIVYPTDTVYGLGADAMDSSAVGKVRMMKGIGEGKPLSVMVSGLQQIERMCRYGIQQDRVLRRCLPGPYTFILEAREPLPCARHGTLGVRMPDHPFCKSLSSLCARPVVSTSANITGGMSPSGLSGIPPSILEQADLVIDAGPIGTGEASTIVDLVHGTLIRQGRGSIDTPLPGQGQDQNH